MWGGGDKFLLGALLGDFVRGRLEGLDYPQDVCEGIALHRVVDVFTDQHPAFRECKALLDPGRRRFAGILVDIFYDHFLSLRWKEFCEDETLPDFISRIYAVLEDHVEMLPETLRAALPAMRQHDWLGSYQTRDGIKKTLERVALRSPRIAPLAEGIADFDVHYEAISQHFGTQFPDALSFVSSWHQTRNRDKKRHPNRGAF